MSRELNEWELNDKREAEEIVRKLSNFVNTMSRNPEHFVNAVMREHRTLQQSMFGVFMACVSQWAVLSDEGQYDLRNEATVKMSKKIMSALDGECYVPLI